MTVSTTSRLAGPFTGTGADATLPFTFKVTSAADVAVYRDNAALTVDADYTVNINSDQTASPGGSVAILAAAYIAGSAIYVASNITPDQETAIPNPSGFFPKVIEAAFDKLTMLVQQLMASVSRAALAPMGETMGAYPAATSRAGNFLAFDDSGNPIAASSVTGAPVDVDPTLAANSDLIVASQKAAKAYVDAMRGDLASTANGKGGGLVVFSQTATYAVDTVGGRLQEIVYITDAPFNADRTGVTSAVAAINAALVHAGITGKAVCSPAGTFLLDMADGAIVNPGVPFLGMGAKTVFQISGVGSPFTNSYTLPASGGYTLADAALHATSITLNTSADAAHFAVDSYAIIASGAAYDTPALDTQRKGEFVRIKAIVGAVITLYSPLTDSYLAADAAELIPVTLTEGVEYGNFTVKMDKTVPPVAGTDAGTEDRQVITTRFALRPKFHGLIMQDSLGAGIALEGCIGATVEGHEAYDFGSATNTDGTATDSFGGYGYGISERGLNVGLRANGLYYERIRHGYTNGASYIFVHGRPVGASISNGTHVGAKLSGWDTHQLGFGQRFDNLWSIASMGCGFTTRCNSVRMAGCGAIDCLGAAVALFKGATENAEECVVDGFYARGNNWGNDGETDWTLQPTFLNQGDNNTFKNFTVDSAYGPLYSTGPDGTGGKLLNGTAKNLNMVGTPNMAIWLRYTGADAPIIRDVEIDVSNGMVSDLVRNDSANGDNMPLVHNLLPLNGSISGKYYYGYGVGVDTIVHWTGDGFEGHRKSFTLNGSNTISLAGVVEHQITVSKTAAETLDTATGERAEGALLIVIAGSSGITITHANTGVDTFYCKGAVNAALTSGQSITFIKRSGQWVEWTRSF